MLLSRVSLLYQVMFLIALAAGTGLLVTRPVQAQTAQAASPGDWLKTFGVTGDGTTDDTDAIQKAVSSGLGSLSFPKGTYRLSKTIQINLAQTGWTSITGDGTAHFLMTGAGPAFRVIGTHQKSADPKQFSQQVWDKERTPQFVGIEITGTHPEADGLDANGVMQLTVSRVVVRKTRNAIRLFGNNRNVLIDACHLYENSGVGLLLDDVNLHQINVTGSHISYNGGGGIVCRGGNVRNLQIGNCDIESNHDRNGQPTANVLIDSTGSQYGIAEVAITGCTIQHNSESPDSANIRILGQSETAEREGYITITGNIISDVQTNLHLQQCRGVTITGNTFWTGYQRDVLLDRCVSVVMSGNAFDRNPRVKYGKTLTAKGGLQLVECSGCILSALQINEVQDHPAGISLDRCSQILINACLISNCHGAAILLKDSTNCRVQGCLLSDTRTPEAPAPTVKVEGGSGHRIEE